MSRGRTAEEFLQSLRESEKLPPLKPPKDGVPLDGMPFSHGLRVALGRLDAGDAGVLSHFAHVHRDFVALYDGKPKSSVHLLAMPRIRVEGIRSLTKHDLPMLERLAAYCTWLQEELSAQFPALTWRHGAHANPSCKQLHIHVMSQDFRSHCMNNKKRWNSFQPPFLVPLQEMMQNLQADCQEGALGTLDVASADLLLQSDIQCHSCGWNFGSNFRALQRHLERCQAIESQPPPLVMAALQVVQDDASLAPGVPSHGLAIEEPQDEAEAEVRKEERSRPPRRRGQSRWGKASAQS
mmetsp:Transcript_30973/g.56603  ORF Transcript_30973/g.56603 Transcript_30973/m.56603 type:complete len:295 (-) Transcript_30973:143-1027(-)